MKVQLSQILGCLYVEGDAAEQFLRTEHDAVELIGLCGEHDTHRLLLHAANLPDQFFDLKSGLAGAILQKFVNYHMKVALIIPPELLKGKFRDYVLEANRGKHFRSFLTRIEAERWLTSD
jgi:PadR family transcriptional regulator, regulatory protein AphA